jgi:protein phosphatase methylesterase 1
MSLLKSAMNARIAKLPAVPPYPSSGDGNHGDDDDDEEVEARDGLGSLSLDPPLPKHRRSLQSSNAKALDPALSPLSASTHFAQAIQVSVPLSDLDFRVYITPPTVATDGNGKYGSIIVCHHGAGYSALSFACLAKEVVQSTSGECGFMAFDARAHGGCRMCVFTCYLYIITIKGRRLQYPIQVLIHLN